MERVSKAKDGYVAVSMGGIKLPEKLRNGVKNAVDFGKKAGKTIGEVMKDPGWQGVAVSLAGIGMLVGAVATGNGHLGLASIGPFIGGFTYAATRN